MFGPLADDASAPQTAAWFRVATTSSAISSHRETAEDRLAEFLSNSNMLLPFDGRRGFGLQPSRQPQQGPQLAPSAHVFLLGPYDFNCRTASVSTVFAHPCEGTFDNPSFWKNNETFHIDRQQNRVENAVAVFQQPRRQSTTSVRTIGKNNFQPLVLNQAII